jgi:hypothetical protein
MLKPVIVLVIAVAIGLRLGFRRVGLVLLGICVATAPMNAVRFQELPVSDIFLAMAFGALWVAKATESRSDRSRFFLPKGLCVASGLFVLVGLLNEVFATSRTYLASRTGESFSFGVRSLSNLGQLSKFLVAILILPLVVMYAHVSQKEGLTLVRMWLIGTTISAAIGLTDLLGFTALGIVTNGGQNGNNRVAGLTIHPNHLAASVAMAIPLVLALPRGTARARWISDAVLGVLIAGAFASGSRTGQAGVLLALTTSVMLQPALRAKRRAALPLIGLIAAFFLARPEFLLRLLERTRFAAGAAGQSNTERAMLRAQGIEDFLHRPLIGIGYEHLNGAHEVHIQIAAATGAIGIVAAIVYSVAVFRAAKQARAVHYAIGTGLLLSMGCWMALAFTSNLVADRYLYVPVALAFAFARLESSSGRRESENGARTTARSPAAPSVSEPVPAR